MKKYFYSKLDYKKLLCFYCLALFTWMFSGPLSAGTKPHIANEIVFKDCIHPESVEINWKDGNTVVISIFCTAGNILEEVVKIISSWRPDDDKEHEFENAYDGHYEFSDKECVWRSYKRHIKAVLLALEIMGLLNKSGVGIYFKKNGKGSQLSIHIDLRGKKARWTFIGEEMVTFEIGLDYLDELIENECHD